VKLLELDTFFGQGRNIVQAEAPGRLDVMGGIADYSGSLVLEMPIDRSTCARVALRDDDEVNVHSETASSMSKVETVSVHLSDFLGEDGIVDYSLVRTALDAQPGCDWAAYVVGCPLVLMKEKGMNVPGMDAWISSDLPSGRGVSASAALEVATMAALVRAMGTELGRLELPILCQKVENYVVGAACGLMDQLTTYLGERNRLLQILCQPAEVRQTIPIPDGVHFIGVDSGAEHSIGGSSYTNVRVAAFIGYSIIAEALGVTAQDIAASRASKDCSSLPYKGYLANIPVAEFEAEYDALLPESITGEAFLDQFGGTIDPVTEVKAGVDYAVRTCTQHPVYEHDRVLNFARNLDEMNSPDATPSEIEARLARLGELMLGSHESYSRCGLGHPATDALVNDVVAAGPSSGVFGAKITGGGSGGTVCILYWGDEGLQTAIQIARDHWARMGLEPVMFLGSRDGAFLS